MKKNINLFSGENAVFLNKELDRWIRLFEDKYGVHNITRIHKDNIGKISFISELMTPPFLSEFRLIVIDDIFGISEKTDDNIDKTSTKIVSDLTGKLEDIPEDNIIIFISRQTGKNNELFKKIKEIGMVKEFKNLDESSLRTYIREKVISIDNEAIECLLKYKGLDISKIDPEIDKLILYKNNTRITKEDIENYVGPEVEVSIFELIDELYLQNHKASINKLRAILNDNKIEPILAGILSNIRKYLFVIYLLKTGSSEKEIALSTKIHPYIVQKSIKNSAKYNSIKNLYNKLVQIEFKLKTGELIGDSDMSFKLSFEKMILDLKNNKKDLE